VTKRTKTELSNQVTSLLPNNSSGQISPEDVRSVFTDTADSLLFWNNSVPPSTSDTCSVGEFKFGSIVVGETTVYHLYVCVGTDTWRRAELVSF
jgi:hypothetical protein